MSPSEIRVLLLILGSLAADSALGDPCVTHTVLDQPWRSTDCSSTECTGRWMDDGDLVVGWYRFNSSGGRKIPETVVPVNHCSGERAGWLNGSHPSVGEGEVTRTVCFTWDGNTCYWNREIRVKNCSGYFVCRLKPSLDGHSVYCTDRQTSGGEGHTGSSTRESPPGTAPCPSGGDTPRCGRC
ncbi:pancreatic secretory granule membrane major glycoprotein GP2-like [Pristis pectinata]|uniref:pancreatic secretory granule membrane major glycoprotein GP2-like n=1 Tax=Pristis pectinata TaxID=685728 RepID=UPI00223E45E2|nr:pancreatic secretory granule membrane major glycoprotein GP2-like [Pristis pectinata]XP_051883937.1 pancreatic secretory granule membrane major glycoprotein GP2-like [Pristis pectinata]